MKKEGMFLVLISIIFLVSFVGASFNVSDSSLQKEVVRNTTISGSVNISFSDEVGTSLFNDSFGNTVELLDVLKNSNYKYNCSTGDGCPTVYSGISPISQKNFLLETGKEKVFGLVLNENITNITGFKFTLSSTAGVAEKSQFSIDLFDDGSVEMKNLKIGPPRFLSKTFGCYNTSHASVEISISETPYCELVTIGKTPGIDATAFVKEEFAGTNNVNLSLYSKEGKYIDSCSPDKKDFTSNGSDVSCAINHPVMEESQYYVCLSANTTGSAIYKTKGYSSQDSCGFLGEPVQEPTNAYRIGAILKRYAAPGEVKYENTLSNGADLVQLIKDYLNKKYNMDCKSESCYIPIKIISNANQEFVLKNLELSYDAVGLPGATLSQFYEFNKVHPLITSENQSLSLNGFFKVPDVAGEYNYSLKLDGKEILSKNITVKDLRFSIYPQTVALNYPTSFKVDLGNKNDIAMVTWDFGDATGQTTSTTLEKSHKYTTRGNFTILVTVKTQSGEEYSKNFKINVTSAKDAIKKNLDNKSANLNALKLKLNSLSSLKKMQLERWVNFSEFEERLNSLEQNESDASSDSDYNKIIDAIFEKPFPVLYSESLTGKRYFAPDTSKINLDFLGNITKKNYNGTEEEKNYSLYWTLKNLNPTINSEKISIEWENKSVDKANLFTIKFKGPSNKSYFVIEDLDGLNFTNNEKVLSGSGYKYIPLTESMTQISFITSEDLSIPALPAFFSPANLSLSDENIPTEKKTDNTILILLIIGILIFITLIAYIVLHWWYKVKYEKYLFKDRNQLYNLSLYINSSIKGGMEDSEIRGNLKNAGWSGEQITYAMRKYAGKRTGMPDLFGVFRGTRKEVPERKDLHHESKKFNLETYAEFKIRNPWFVGIMSVITFGIYFAYWIISTDIRLKKMSKKAPSPYSYLFVLIPIIGIIVSIFYEYKFSKAVEDITQADTALIFITLLLIFPIGAAITQSKINKNKNI